MVSARLRAEKEALSSANLNSRCVHLCMLGLYRVPEHIFTLTRMIRLDLGHNELSELSPSVGRLSQLEELWVNHNPRLKDLPKELRECGRLVYVDARRTSVDRVPPELSRLGLNVHIETGTHVVDMKELARQDERAALQSDMVEKLSRGLYREEEDEAKISSLVSTIAREFDVDEMRRVLRNADRLVPKKIDTMRLEEAALLARKKFDILKKENDRKRMSAELELKMRALYYDKIDPAKVEGYVADIYAFVKELEDVEFLVKYASKLFPDKVEDIRGSDILANIKNLQKSLDSQREKCVADLYTTLSQTLYPDIEPRRVSELAQKACDQFRRHRFATTGELRNLKKLTADAEKLFPADFSAAPSRLDSMCRDAKGLART